MYNAPSIDIATMPIADKVHRYANAKYYKALLDALQAAANEVGCDFALSSRDAAYIPEDIYEHLAFNLVLAREQYLRPAIGSIAHYENAESGMKDGYAHLLLRDVLSALSELGLKWRIRSIEYYDREGLQRAQARRTNGGSHPCQSLLHQLHPLKPMCPGWQMSFSTGWIRPRRTSQHEYNCQDRLRAGPVR
ncbi:hypothetical protein JII91_29540 (plasmid) [Klebsiella quasipneumoniae]|uniref:hypothetical protein n=1 Tax=Klebsiella quasipneumoniae TaxID=1463165 RepID=UPI0019151ECC|nr:hypothetical protein [Klebsiella quasipneumoniae]QQM83412.1 hypothetical protein JII91_29540 [Klebsiella quasipneumoniae]